MRRYFVANLDHDAPIHLLHGHHYALCLFPRNIYRKVISVKENLVDANVPALKDMKFVIRALRHTPQLF